MKGGAGDAHRLGRLVVGEASKEDEVDRLCLAGIKGRELFERVVERLELACWRLRGQLEVVELYRSDPAATLDACLRPAAIDQDTAHQARRDREEVRAVFEGGLDPNEPQKGLMHQRRGGERLAWAFAREVVLCQPAQLVINERHESRQGFAVSLVPGKE